MGFLAKLFAPAERKVWPVHVDDENFVDEVRRSSLPVMLDVWGPSCAPCRQMEPIVFRLAKQYQGRVKVAEINAAAAPRTMKKLFVAATPTIIYFNKGQEVERVIGLRGERHHQALIDSALLGAADVPTSSGQESPPG
jgi:thioredoxin-like negative regulator of GroEL